MFPRNGMSEQMEQFSYGKSLAGKENYEDRKSTWNSGVRKVITRESAEEEVRKHQKRVTGAWKQVRNKDNDSMLAMIRVW